MIPDINSSVSSNSDNISAVSNNSNSSHRYIMGRLNSVVVPNHDLLKNNINFRISDVTSIYA